MTLQVDDLSVRHQQLLELVHTLEPAEVLPQIESFLTDLATAGGTVTDTLQRSQLRNFIRFWSSYVYDHTGRFPEIHLFPAQVSVQPTLSSKFFVDRETELNQLGVERLRASRSPCLLLTGAAGYGKTSLLSRLRQELVSNRETAARWVWRYVDFNGADDQIAHAVQQLTNQTSPTAPLTAQEVALHLIQELTKPLYEAEGRRSVLLMLDAVEQLREEAQVWVYGLLTELYKRTRVGAREIMVVRLIITGRNAESFWESYQAVSPTPLPVPQRISLGPFDEHPIQELIWKSAEVAQILLDDETVNQIADEVLHLSGGHPAIIQNVVDELVRQSFAVGTPRDYFAQQQVTLVQRHVAPVARELLQELDERLVAVVQVLSMFRRLNANTVQVLVEAGQLLPDLDAVQVLGELRAVNLLTVPTIREPFYHLHFIRPIVALDLLYHTASGQAQYQRLNELALALYADWIHDAHRNLAAAHRLLSLVEWLFHALQAPDFELAGLHNLLRHHMQTLLEEVDPQAAELVAAEIRQDAEITYLLHRRLGADGVLRVCEWLEMTSV